MQWTIAFYQCKLFNLFPFSAIEFSEVVMFKPWTQGILFFSHDMCTSFRIMTPYFTMWANKYSAMESVYLVFARSWRSALFIITGRICCKENPENQECAVWLFFFYLLLVASLRFSLLYMYLCVQFVFSAAALHFLIRWIRRLITLRCKGVYIPSLHFFCENNPEPWPVFFFVLWQMKTSFSITIIGSYTSENNCSCQ